MLRNVGDHLPNVAKIFKSTTPPRDPQISHNTHSTYIECRKSHLTLDFRHVACGVTALLHHSVCPVQDTSVYRRFHNV